MPKRSICSKRSWCGPGEFEEGLREAEDRFHVFPREAAKAAFHHNFFYLCFLRQRCGGKRCCQYGYCQRTPSPERNPLTVEFHHVQDPGIEWLRRRKSNALTPRRRRGRAVTNHFGRNFTPPSTNGTEKACTKAIRYRDLSKSLALQPPTRGWHERVYARREQRQSMFRNYCTRADQWRDLHILT